MNLFFKHPIDRIKFAFVDGFIIGFSFIIAMIIKAVVHG